MLVDEKLKIMLIDFGLSTRFEIYGKHVKQNKETSTFEGTTKYQSVNI